MKTLQRSHFVARSGYLHNPDAPTIENFPTSYAGSSFTYTNKLPPIELRQRCETQKYSVSNLREYLSTITSSSFREKPPRTNADVSKVYQLPNFDPQQPGGYDRNRPRTFPYRNEYFNWQSRVAERIPAPVGRPDSYQNTFARRQ